MMRRPLALAAPALLAGSVLASGCAQTPAEAARTADAQRAVADSLDARLAGLTPGQAQSCLPSTLTTSSTQLKAYGPTLLYVVSRNLVYRNDTTGGCENVGRGDILVTVQPEGRACKGDIARTVEPVSHTTSGSCALGNFVRYERPR